MTNLRYRLSAASDTLGYALGVAAAAITTYDCWLLYTSR